MLDGKHRETAARCSVTGDQPADRTVETYVALRVAAAGAIAIAHRLRGEGYLNVRITDTTTDEPCEEADLERAAQTEGG